MTETLDKMNGQLILELLVASNRAVIDNIYKECYPSVKHMVIANSGTISDAEDIFQDAFTLVIEKAKKRSLELTCSIKTYIYSVSFNMWQKQLTRKLKVITLPEGVEFSDDSDHEQKAHYDILYEIFSRNFMQLKPESQKILNMYLSKYPMKEITREMGYANEEYAKVKKYLCKEHLKKNIYNDPKFIELTLTYSN
jgi:RNA polymerase sigma factor (sigma-70 family)